MKQAAKAFSLIELLVIIAIIAVLVAVLVPGLGLAKTPGPGNRMPVECPALGRCMEALREPE